jgi:hypothetical protein
MTDLGLAGEVQLSDRTLLRRDGGDSEAIATRAPSSTALIGHVGSIGTPPPA